MLDDPIRKTILCDQNAIYYRYPIEKLMENAGKGIAKVLTKKYGRKKRIGFFSGPGNNGGDGFAAARYLKKISQPEVYLISGAKDIKTPESRKNWQRFRGVKYDNVRAGSIPNHFDVVVECLFGTGAKGKVKEPYASVIRKLNRLKGKKVTLDLPAPGFKADFAISMMFRKVPGAAVVPVSYPENIKHKIGVGEIKILHKPQPKSHKGMNGKLLIIAGSDEYHGALLFAAKTASRIVDIVYIASTAENNEIVRKLKPKLADFIPLSTCDVDRIVDAAKKTDAILVGPGLGVSEETKIITNSILQELRTKKVILDADALKVLDKKLLHQNCILTPHKGEFRKLFGEQGTRESVKKMARKYNCTIVLKGAVDYVCSPNECKINTAGNAGMTKGGTGDVLSGLIAALAAKNDSFLAASAGVFINGLAADRLKKKVSFYYNASDLINEIPKTIKWAQNFKSQI